MSPNYIHKSIMNHNHISQLKPIEYIRYKSSKPIHVLQEEWEMKYNISQTNQLVFNKQYQSSSYKLFNFKQKFKKHIKKQTFLLIDSSKVVILTEHKARLFDSKNDDFDSLRQFELAILQYFDIKKQTITFSQFILYHPRVTYLRLLYYIENEYIIFNSIDNKWYFELKNILNQMTIPLKMAIYTHPRDKKGNMNRCNRIGIHPNDHWLGAWKKINLNRFTFQINPRHPWWLNHANINKYFHETMTKCKQKYIPFHNRVDLYRNNYTNIIVCIYNHELLKNVIQKYYKLNLNKNEREIFKSDINKVLKIIKRGVVCLQLNTSIPITFLKMKLAKQFDNIINPKYFELYTQCPAAKAFKSNDLLCAKIRSPYNTIGCSIVFYDTLLRGMDANVQMYHIQIHKPSESPHPIDFSRYAKPRKIITVRYKPIFKVKHLINYLFKSNNFLSSNHILFNEFKEYINLYNSNKNGISFIITHESGYGKKTPVYKMDDEYKYPGCCDLHMIRIKPYEPLRNIKLKLKFVSNEADEQPTKCDLNIETNIKNINDLDYIGLPLNVWINKNDSLDEIIRNNLNKVYEYIISCYRININDKKIMIIPKKIWNNYKPYSKFLWNQPNDILIFKVMQPRPNLNLTPRFTQTKNIYN
eukprot:271774_1